MFLEVSSNLINVTNIVRVYNTEGGVTIIEMKNSESLRILDSDKSKYKQIIKKIESNWNVLHIE